MDIESVNITAQIVGYTVIAGLVMVFIIGVGGLVAELAFRKIWLRMIGTYEMHILHWWMTKIKKTGRVIPTRKAVRELLDGIDDE